MSSERQTINGHLVTDEERDMVEKELGGIADLWEVELHHREQIKDDHFYDGKDIRGLRSLKETIVVTNPEDAIAIVTDWFDCCGDEDLETDYENLGAREFLFADAKAYDEWREIERKRKAELNDAVEAIKSGSIGLGQFLAIDLKGLFEPGDTDEERIVIAHDIGRADKDGDPLSAYLKDVCNSL